MSSSASGTWRALVGVLDAEDERAGVAAGEEVVVERGAEPADVEEPGGARGEADADVVGHAGRGEVGRVASV
jgi:hypothetical protein